MGKFATSALLIVLVAAAGCTRSTNALNINTRNAPQPLPSQPSGNVQVAQLEPPPAAIAAPEPVVPDVPQAPEAPKVEEVVDDVAEQAKQEVASLEPPKQEVKPITHETMAGSWNVTSDNSDCKLILSFTQWSGGYRAATLRCNSPELSAVNAWDIANNRVLLKDSNGNEVARVASAGATSYAGTTVGGNAVSFGR